MYESIIKFDGHSPFRRNNTPPKRGTLIPILGQVFVSRMYRCFTLKLAPKNKVNLRGKSRGTEETLIQRTQGARLNQSSRVRIDT